MHSLATFSPRPTSKDTTNVRPRHAARHVCHARAVMHVGVANPRWWGKRSRHSQRMHDPQFYVSGKRPVLSALNKAVVQETPWSIQPTLVVNTFINLWWLCLLGYSNDLGYDVKMGCLLAIHIYILIGVDMTLASYAVMCNNTPFNQKHLAVGIYLRWISL